MKAMKTLTTKFIRQFNPCDREYNKFVQLFGESVEITLDNCILAVKGLLSCEWVVSKLTVAARQAYDRTVALAGQAYGGTVAEARQAYDEAVASYDEALVAARQAYGGTVAEARQAYYDETLALVGQAYSEAAASARRACDEALALARQAYDGALALALYETLMRDDVILAGDREVD
jgi:hypothetical protein